MDNCILLIVWLSVTLGFAILRSSTVLIWDDSPRLSHFLFEPSAQIIDEKPRTLIRGLTEAFSETTASGYRPLSMVINELGLTWFSQDHYISFFWFLGVGAIIATLVIFVIIVARHYLITTGAAYFASFLFLFSTSVITGGWVVFAGIQAIVPLLICLGLVIYWKILEKPRLESFYLVALCLVLLLGPWFREFIGLLPLLLIIQEFQRRRYFSRIVAISSLSFLHALYPTAITRLIFPGLPLKPVFAIGSLGSQLEGGESLLFQKISLLNWHVSWHFFSLFPPLLLCLILFSFIIAIKSVNLSNIRKQRFLFSSLICFVSFLFVCGIYLLSSLKSPIKGFFLLTAIVLILLVTLYQAQVKISPSKRYKEYKKSDVNFLLIWFLLSFLPFLKVYTSQVHLAYAVLPAAILVSGSVEHLWQYMYTTRREFSKLFYLASFLIFIVTSDHALNLYGSYRVVSGINRGILTISIWVKGNLPENSIVVSNFLHIEDIRLYSDNYFTPFWTVTGGVPNMRRVIDTLEKLEKLLQENQGKRSIYFLATEFDYTSVKSRYHPHRFVRGRNVEMENLGIIHTTQVKYPYLDPLKVFTPRIYISFLGSPDLENDFYRGAAQNGQPMVREIYAEYHLFKVTGSTVNPWNPFATIYLIRAGYKGFNVLEVDGKFFAIPQGEGSSKFDKSLRKEDYSQFFVADELKEIYSQIDQAIDKI